MPQDLDKQVRKLLESVEGRSAVGRALGLAIEPKEVRLNHQLGGTDLIPTVAVLVPCYDHVDPQMTNAFNDLMTYTRQQEAAVVYPGPVVRFVSMIPWARNRLVTELLQGLRPWTHVLFWDDDIVPEPDALVKLLSHQKDIIVGLCTCRTDPPIPNIRYWKPEEKRYEEIISWDDGLIEIGAGGTGFMLISRRGLEVVAEAYFNCLVERDIYKMPADTAIEMGKRRREAFDKTAACQWFRCLPYVEGIGEMGEDVSFCHMARHYGGLKVYCDTTVQPGHVGKYEFSARDFIPHRDAWIKEAKLKNKYVAKKEEPSRIIQLQ